MKSRRMSMGMSLQDVADAIGTSKSYTWEIERGCQPSVGYAVNIANILKKPIAYFIEECIDK